MRVGRKSAGGLRTTRPLPAVRLPDGGTWQRLYENPDLCREKPFCAEITRVGDRKTPASCAKSTESDRDVTAAPPPGFRRVRGRL